MKKHNKNKKGLFVVFEGIDMTGKTTIAKGVVEKLKNKTNIIYQKGICSKTWIGRISCHYPSTFLFLMELIYLSITKRFYNSLILKIGRIVLPKPDMLIYCTASKETIIQRLKKDCEKNKYHKWLIDNPEYIDIRKKAYEKSFQQFEGKKIIMDTSFCTLKNSIAEISNLIQAAVDRKVL